jgi:ATP-dependent RNA helicase RhlB
MSAEDTGFSEFRLDERIAQSIREIGYEKPTEIQEKVIPLLLKETDVIGVARTGTGKTAAYLLPLIHSLLQKNLELSAGEAGALVLAPTRELAHQIQQEAIRFTAKVENFRSAVILGGESYEDQIGALKKGAHVVIGTPGRLIDLQKSKRLRLDKVSWLVLDEADQLLDLGFKDDLNFLIRKTPKERVTSLFSATMEIRVRALAYKYLNEPIEVQLVKRQESATAEGVEQQAFHVGMDEKLLHLAYFFSNSDNLRAMIFCNTKEETSRLAHRLTALDFRAAGISSRLPQKKRQSLLKNFREGRMEILVATDVASRGLDIDDVSQVVNYDVPRDPETYVHRIGRTARAGRTGKAFTLVDPRDSEAFQKLERYLREKIPIGWIEDKDYELLRPKIEKAVKEADRKYREESRLQKSRKVAKKSSKRPQSKRRRDERDDRSSSKKGITRRKTRKPSQKRSAPKEFGSKGSEPKKVQGSKRPSQTASFKSGSKAVGEKKPGILGRIKAWLGRKKQKEN